MSNCILLFEYEGLECMQFRDVKVVDNFHISHHRFQEVPAGWCALFPLFLSFAKEFQDRFTHCNKKNFQKKH